MYEYRVASVVKVIDGDTVDVIIDLGFDILVRKRVRVAGIDTPEKRTTNAEEKRRGLAATDYAKDWFRTHKDNLIVRTELPDSTEKYGRILGHFIASDSTDFGECIIAAGLAWEYDGGKKVKDMSLLKEA